MGVDETNFHDAERIALIPIGLCYPGRGAGGDLPPRPERAPLWLDALLVKLPRVELTLLVGVHAQRRFLGDRRQRTPTETRRTWRDLEPAFLPLPHPSPRNMSWIRARPWIEHGMLPERRLRIHAILDH
jgi:uracil-DNA glycosylase